MKKIICKCGKKFTLGVNGTIAGCDKCTGVERDKDGYVWHLFEADQERMDVATGEISVVTRREAFGKCSRRR
jgi:predicted  nucleic acid-binding Zn-ribbon protein